MSTNCAADTPDIGSNCQDPAYRAAHPEECSGATLLILTPEHVLKEPGQTVQYTVILRANGQEIELTQGLAFSSSNVGAAVVNDEGVATAVAAGATTISVGWQN